MLHDRSVRAISRRLAGVRPGDVASDVVAGNPGAKSSKEHLTEAMDALKKYRDVLQTTMDKFGALDPENVKEFMSVFDDKAAAEKEVLENLMREVRSASDRTAGPMDFVKGLFKKKEKPAKEDKAEDQPSYDISDDEMDSFVQGIDVDKGAKVDRGFKVKKDFDSGMSTVKKTMETLDKSPTKEGIEKLLKKIDQVIELGVELLGGKPDKRGHAPPSPKADKPQGFKTPNAMVTVKNYVDLINDNESNPEKVKKLLKELFQTLRVDVASKK